MTQNQNPKPICDRKRRHFPLIAGSKLIKFQNFNAIKYPFIIYPNVAMT